jgi:hypothetical protein
LAVKLYRRRYNVDRDITNSDRIPEVMIAEAAIVSTEAEIEMAEAEIVSYNNKSSNCAIHKIMQKILFEKPLQLTMFSKLSIN